MNNSDQSCCVCLNNYLKLNELLKTDDNDITLFTKLITNIPQIEWLVTYRICDPCTNLLNIVNTFRETCVKSDNIRRKQLDALNFPKAEEDYVKNEYNNSSEDNDLCTNVKEDDGDELDDDPNDDRETCVKSDNIRRKQLDALNFPKAEEDYVKNEYNNSSEDIDLCTNVKEDDGDELDDDPNGPIYSDNSSEKNVQKKKSRGRVATRKFTCEICTEEFNLLKAIIEHCVQVHAMEEKTVRPYSCDKCTNRFRSSTNLINHRLYHERNRINICSFCGKSFITKNDLAAHKNLHYSCRNYKCDKCEKAFKTNNNLRTHHLIVHTDPSLWKFVCHICSKRFPQKSNHDQHVRRHIGEKNFICPRCKKPFASKSEMQEHISYHLNVRAYKCEYCGKEYRKKHTYDVHLTKLHGVGNAKIPVMEKKHACHICPSRFYDKLKLARHLCIHSGLKPFPCYACDKKFTDKSYLKHHLKIVHNIIAETKTEWVNN